MGEAKCHKNIFYTQLWPFTPPPVAARLDTAATRPSPRSLGGTGRPHLLAGIRTRPRDATRPQPNKRLLHNNTRAKHTIDVRENATPRRRGRGPTAVTFPMHFTKLKSGGKHSAPTLLPPRCARPPDRGCSCLSPHFNCIKTHELQEHATTEYKTQEKEGGKRGTF